MHVIVFLLAGWGHHLIDSSQVCIAVNRLRFGYGWTVNRLHFLVIVRALLKMLDISKIYMYNVQMFMFKRYHCLLPDIFNSFFCKNVDITGRETRQSENLRIPEGVIGIRRRTIRFSGVSLNNFFHNKISYKYSINLYKFQLKEYLLSGSSLPLIPK